MTLGENPGYKLKYLINNKDELRNKNQIIL